MQRFKKDFCVFIIKRFVVLTFLFFKVSKNETTITFKIYKCFYIYLTCKSQKDNKVVKMKKTVFILLGLMFVGGLNALPWWMNNDLVEQKLRLLKETNPSAAEEIKSIIEEKQSYFQTGLGTQTPLNLNLQSYGVVCPNNGVPPQDGTGMRYGWINRHTTETVSVSRGYGIKFGRSFFIR